MGVKIRVLTGNGGKNKTMISIYKKYHVAYWCIGIVEIIGMVIANLWFCRHTWVPAIPVTAVTILLVMVDAFIFTKLTSKKLSNEVLPLFYNCQVHKFIDEMNRLFAKKAKGPVVSMYNSIVARGYGSIDDYDSVYECCQKIKSKGYKSEYHRLMIEYYLKNDQFDKAQEEMDALRKLMEKMKNPKYIESCEDSIKNAEFYMRIQQGNYEGAEEHYQKQLDTIKPLYPITEASYSHALGKLLVLKGEPERARKYLQVAIDLGGDTKYKKFAEELLQEINQ